MLELFGFRKRHIDAAKNRRFRAGRLLALHDQRNLPGGDITHRTLKIRALCVADRNALAGLQAEHLGMRGVFTGQNQKPRARRSLGNKKLGHRAFLPFP